VQGFQTGCEHGCINTEGSYRCTCKALYTLGNDGHSCDGITSFAAGVSGIGGFFILVIAILATCVIVYVYRTRRKRSEAQAQRDDPLARPYDENANAL
jgi:cbb3-type cytochrome oxidase subunit 3